MPIYEYRCADGHEFEVEQRITEAPIKKCIHCQAAARRLISLPGIVFKGSGFHVTDYRPKGGAAGSPGGSASKGPDAKPAASKPSESKSETPSKPSKESKSS